MQMDDCNPVQRAVSSMSRYTDRVRMIIANEHQEHQTIGPTSTTRLGEFRRGAAQGKAEPSARKAAPFWGPKNGTRACSLINNRITRGPENGTRFGAEKRHQNWGRVL